MCLSPSNALEGLLLQKNPFKMRLITFFFFLNCHFVFSQVTPLPNAHAHNDYEHTRPLLDALAQGFTSVEADVYLIDNELYVYHDRPQATDPARTLTKLYLQPLWNIVQQNGGTVYPNYKGDFYLMIDIKAEGKAVYALLKKQLEPFKKMLTSYENGQQKQGAVTIFLSGDRPMETVQADSARLVGIDGRPGDLGKYDTYFMPVISDNYKNIIKWDGKGNISPEALQNIKQLTAAAHANKQKVRLWATPENENVWKVLQEAGVDLLNTDQLERLKQFLLK